MSDDAKPALELCEFRIEKKLIPDWSNVVEKICLHHGENVGADMELNELVIRVEIDPENKPGMMRDIQSFWGRFVEARQAMGQWDED